MVEGMPIRSRKDMVVQAAAALWLCGIRYLWSGRRLREAASRLLQIRMTFLGGFTSLQVPAQTSLRLHSRASSIILLSVAVAAAAEREAASMALAVVALAVS